jgi:hypothetical protein
MNAADFRRIALRLEGAEEGSHVGGSRSPAGALRNLRNLAERVYTARLPSGASLGDAGDFKQWLMQLAEKAEQVETVE